MLFNLADTLQHNRRLLFVAAFIGIDLLLLTLCSQSLQTHRAGINNRIYNAEISLVQTPYQAGGNESMTESFSRAATTMEVKTLRATVAAADGLSRADRMLRSAAKATVHAVRTAISTTIRIIVMVIAAIFRALGITLLTIVRVLWAVIVFMGKVLIFPFVALGKGAGYVFGTVSGPVNGGLASVIQPQNDAKVPIITPEQAQQVTIIQENTLEVEPIKPAGSGGACDNGYGNGGYPMEWCDARMDSLRTVPYSSDRINRQCTSYAYWYFTKVEGHTDFRVSGNANRWAKTSNYPTHATPKVGAIAVETRGYYGHVAIVQALAGETYEGKVVPDGYVLVSEMNYDWQGHFRYSYSPISKFSSYIYP